MYVYYLTAMMCLQSMPNLPRECRIVWERGPIHTAAECQARAKTIQPDRKWNKLTCWFREPHLRHRV